MSIARKILSNTFAQIFGKVMSALVSVLIIKIITNYLSLEGYGEYTTIYEFLAFFAIAADLGLFTIGVREMSKNEDQMPLIAGNILGIRLTLSIIAMAAAVIAAFLIPQYENTLIPIGCAIAALTTILSLLHGTAAIVLQVKLKMQWPAITFILGRIVTLAYMTYIVFVGIPESNDMGFLQLLVAGVVGNALMFAGTYYYANREIELRPRFDLKFWRETLKESLPYGLAIILSTIYFRIDSILLYFLKDSTEVGVYAVPMRMLEVLTIVPLYFMNSVLPILTKAIKENQEKAQRIIQYAWDFLATAVAPIITGTLIIAYPLIFLVSSPEFLSRLSEGFYGSDIALQILIFALGFQFLNVLFAFILIAVNQQAKLLYINAFAVIFNIIGNFIFIPDYGLRGAASTSVISELIILIGTCFAAHHYLKFKINLTTTIKVLISVMTMGIIIWPMKAYMPDAKTELLLIPLGGLIYMGMLFLTKAVSKDMLKLLKKA